MESQCFSDSEKLKKQRQRPHRVPMGSVASINDFLYTPIAESCLFSAVRYSTTSSFQASQQTTKWPTQFKLYSGFWAPHFKEAVIKLERSPTQRHKNDLRSGKRDLWGKIGKNWIIRSGEEKIGRGFDESSNIWKVVAQRLATACSLGLQGTGQGVTVFSCNKGNVGWTLRRTF